MAKLTKKGALAVVADQERLANLYQKDWGTLGVPQKIALDFARRCDLLSDHLDNQVGIDRRALTEDPKPKLDYPQTGQTFDAEEIGQEDSGPLEQEPDEPFMKDEFTQQRFRELREKQEGGDLGAVPNDEQTPTPGRQATFEALGRREAAGRLGGVSQRLQKAALALAETRFKALSQPLTHLAGRLLDIQTGVLGGSVDGPFTNVVLKAATEVLPHVESPVAENGEKVARMLNLAAKVAAKKAEDDDQDEKAEDDEKEGGKKKANLDHGYDLTAK